VIEFTPKKEGTFVYTCWMWMIISSIKVVPDITKVQDEDINDTGEYFIEANDKISNASLLKIKLKSLENRRIEVKDTLRPYAIIKGNIGAVADTAIKRYVVIYGLERLIPVTDEGIFEIRDLPSGTFHLRIISLHQEWKPLDIENITIHPSESLTIDLSDSLQVSNDSIHKIMIKINTTSSGVLITKDIYNFPLLLRLTSENFDFDKVLEDGNDIRVVKKDTATPLPFEIERWDKNNRSAIIWVRIDTIYSNSDSQYIWLIYGETENIYSHSICVFDTSDNFMAVYHFSDNLTDATPNKFNGIDSGTNELTNSIIGKGRAFNGSSQFFTIGDLPDRQTGTISFWFKPNKTVDAFMEKTMGIWGTKQDDNTDYHISLQGKEFYAGRGVPGALIAKQEKEEVGYYLSSKTQKFSNNNWYYVTWCWDQKHNYLYLNGALEDSIGGSVSLSAKAIEEIGRVHYDVNNIAGGGPLYFNGALDEFRIENICRSQDWIKLAYYNQQQNNTNLLIFEKK
ncbi:MAG: DUF2341 domain-containing protein, partial [Chitinispirillaceae bacterium]|nr:DUF2341 domain-containing protein [Chitinispirillaceae bacterium]